MFEFKMNQPKQKIRIFLWQHEQNEMNKIGAFVWLVWNCPKRLSFEVNSWANWLICKHVSFLFVCLLFLLFQVTNTCHCYIPQQQILNPYWIEVIFMSKSTNVISIGRLLLLLVVCNQLKMNLGICGDGGGKLLTSTNKLLWKFLTIC